MGLYDTVAGVGDHLAGSVDESIARQFDDEAGGGFADYDTYAGVADHAAGSVDESIGRQFDDEPGGGFADVGRTGETNEPETDTYNNRFLQGDFARSLYDAVMDYDGTLNGREDTVDLLGPGLWGSEGSIADVVVKREGEKHGVGETKTKLLFVAVGSLVFLYLVAPLLELIAAMGGDDE